MGLYLRVARGPSGLPLSFVGALQSFMGSFSHRTTYSGYVLELGMPWLALSSSSLQYHLRRQHHHQQIQHLQQHKQRLWWHLRQWHHFCSIIFLNVIPALKAFSGGGAFIPSTGEANILGLRVYRFPELSAL